MANGRTPCAYTTRMAFDHELARKLLRRGDRDSAPFFAGRQEEIRRFDDALDELDDWYGVAPPSMGEWIGAGSIRR